MIVFTCYYCSQGVANLTGGVPQSNDLVYAMVVSIVTQYNISAVPIDTFGHVQHTKIVHKFLACVQFTLRCSH